MVKNHARKNAAKRQGIKHTAALREVGGQPRIDIDTVSSGELVRALGGTVVPLTGTGVLDPLNAGLASPVLAVGDRVRFAGSGQRLWWSVQAADERFAVLTRQATFQPKGSLFYTIVDYARGVRGPADSLGQGWDVESPGGAESLLAALNVRLNVQAQLERSGGESIPVTERSAAVSYRNNVPIEILQHDTSRRVH